MNLTNEQWERIAPLIPPAKSGREGKGRPSTPPHQVLNGILWILRTGAPWKDLPDRYPPHQTCHRWLQRWRKDGVFELILAELAEDLRERGGIDLREALIDGTLAPANRGRRRMGKTKRGKGGKIMRWQTLLVFLSPCT
jgi:transposase